VIDPPAERIEGVAAAGNRHALFEVPARHPVRDLRDRLHPSADITGDQKAAHDTEQDRKDAGDEDRPLQRALERHALPEAASDGQPIAAIERTEKIAGLHRDAVAAKPDPAFAIARLQRQ
jgi:hypothetical protein